MRDHKKKELNIFKEERAGGSVLEIMPFFAVLRTRQDLRCAGIEDWR